MNKLEILKRARALIAKPESWTQEAMARDASGKEIDPDRSEAVRFCIRGALERVACDAGACEPGEVALDILDEVGEAEDVLPVSWNDQPERTHQEVLDLLDRSIESLESRMGKD